ncbi:MAG: tetratricopeptide repeat protein [Candidatus Thioglobus sp.]
MINFNYIKGMLLASLFVFLSQAVFAETLSDRWYKIGYEYSQQGRNDDAFRWMIRAADAGHAAAQNNIGLSYLHGLGAEKDSNKAFHWFERAANQGLPYAQSELAMLYYQGDGVAVNKQMAKDWWTVASKQNDEYAQFNLASLYLELNDIQKAYYWFTIANNNKHPDAQDALEQLREMYVEQY